jgi:hypothetical protein
MAADAVMFGYPYYSTQAGGSGAKYDAHGSLFSLNGDADIASISCLMNGGFSPTEPNDRYIYRFAIYSDSNGKVGTLISQTETGTFIGKPGGSNDVWNTANFPQTVHLTAGKYWLLTVDNASGYIVNHDEYPAANYTMVTSVLGGMNFPATLGSPVYSPDFVLCIYASGIGASSVPDPLVNGQKVSRLFVGCTLDYTSDMNKILITGNLTANYAAIPSAPVLLSYADNPNATWHEIGTVTTASDGSFIAMGISDGSYNLVIAKGSQEVTVCITVSGVNYAAGTVTLPSGNKNSTLEVNGSGTPNVVVDNLNDVFEDSSVYTPANDNDVTTNGATVEIKLTVQKNDSSANRSTVEATMTSGGYASGMVLDVDMTKTVTTSSGALTSETPITAVENLITLIIPLPAELQGKASYVVTRAHDYGSGVVTDTITTTANADNERIVVNSDKTQITLYVKYFSTYAVGYAADGIGSENYVIKSTAGTGGSISPSGTVIVTKGGSKTYTITADEGYSVSDVLVDGKSAGLVGSYTFSDVSTAHTIEAVFARDASLPYYMDASGNKVFLGFAADIGGEIKYLAPDGVTVLFKENPKSFTDTGSHWAKSYIAFVAEREIFVGTGGNRFSPDSGMTRAMFAAVIGRLYERSFGEIEALNAKAFDDCDYSNYYGRYVDWAAKEGIIKGYGNGKFGPEDQITREQMAAILYRFADFLGVLPNDADTVLNYPDAGGISSWAVSAALYCQNAGIITGRDGGRFAPQVMATRAEVSVILERFIVKTLG